MTAPNRRWFRHGEPWGLLAKANSSATPWSVVRRAILFGVTFPWVYAAIIYFRNEPTPNWPWKLVGCTLVCMGVGALSEWQRDVLPE
jgi:hypothetical protein